MARNPAQADMFAHISQLGVELKYAKDCNIYNIEENQNISHKISVSIDE